MKTLITRYRTFVDEKLNSFQQESNVKRRSIKLFWAWLYGFVSWTAFFEPSYFALENFGVTLGYWPKFLIVIAVVAVPLGGLLYYVKGFIFFIGLRIAGVRVKYKEARHVYLIGRFPLFFSSIVIVIGNVIVNGNGFFRNQTYMPLNYLFTVFDIVFYLLYLLLLFNYLRQKYSIHFTKGSMVFIIIPIIYTGFNLLSYEKIVIYFEQWYRLIPTIF